GMVKPDLTFWRDAIAMVGDENVLEAAHHVPGWVVALPLVVGVIGIGAAYLAYVKCTSLPEKAATTFAPVYKFLLNKWYFDELYHFVFVRGALRLGKWFWKFW